jgi:Tol biopolymer transport system component
MIKSVWVGIKPAYRWLFLLVLLGLVLIFGQSRLWGRVNLNGAEVSGLLAERPLILYLGLDENEHDQIYAVSPVTGQATQLTQAPLGVIDFAVSPEGTTVAFSVWRNDAGSDLWALATAGGNQYPLLSCPGAACSGPVWTPDGGTQLVYEQRLLLPDDTWGLPRLWQLNLADGNYEPVFSDEARSGFAAAWSPDGRWLSYTLPDNEGVQIFNVVDGRGFVFPSQTGEPAVWHPQENILLVTHFSPGDEDFATHVLQVDPAQGSWLDLSGDGEPVEDSAPAWSPTGKQLAFTRKPALVAMGRQIWLMQADDGRAKYLTAEPEFYHSRPAWSPDGKALAFHRFSMENPDGEPGIWLFDVESGQMKELAGRGRQPAWLP